MFQDSNHSTWRAPRRPSRWLGPIAFVFAMAAVPAGGQTPTVADDAAIRAEIDATHGQLIEAGRKLARLRAELGETDSREMQVEVFKSRSERPMLGVLLEPDPDAGARVAGVTPGGPAADAGLAAGDVIISIDDKPVISGSPQQRSDDARERLADLADGQIVKLGFQRDGKPQTSMVTVRVMPSVQVIRRVNGEAPNVMVLKTGDPDFKFDWHSISPFAGCSGEDCDHRLLTSMRWTGLELADLDPQLGRYFGTDQGVLVLSARGPALAELESGDVIASVDGVAIDDAEALLRSLRDRKAGEKVRLGIRREGKTLDLAIEAPALSQAFEFLPPPPPAPPAPPAPPRPNQVPAAPAAPAPPAPPPEPARKPGMV